MIRDLLNKASVSVEATQALLEEEYLNDAVSRAYYAMFNAARALILQADPSFNMGGSHGSVTAAFSLHIVRTGLLPKHWGALINEVKSARHAADYGDDAIDVAEVREYLKSARELLAFAVSHVPLNQRPAPIVSPRERVMAERIKEAVKGVVADLLCEAMTRRGETLPPGLSRDLAIYADEDDLRELVLSIDEMQDAKSFVASRISVPSFG